MAINHTTEYIYPYELNAGLYIKKCINPYKLEQNIIKMHQIMI